MKDLHEEVLTIMKEDEEAYVSDILDRIAVKYHGIPKTLQSTIVTQIYDILHNLEFQGIIYEMSVFGTGIGCWKFISLKVLWTRHRYADHEYIIN